MKLPLNNGDRKSGLASKKAKRLRATIVFADESGLMMSPLRKRGWAKRGEAPILRCIGRSYRKISAMAGVAMTPNGRRIRLFFRLLPNQNFGGGECVAFIEQLKQNVRGRIILIWDRIQAHKGRSVTRFLARNKRVETVLLPGYAPELNPVEYVWSWLKYHALSNFVPGSLDALRAKAKSCICSLRKNARLRKGVTRGCPLSLPF